MNEMSNADFINLLINYPANHEDVFMESARRIAKLTKEVEDWKAAVHNSLTNQQTTSKTPTPPAEPQGSRMGYGGN
jgi:hypothetical protein